MDPRDGQRRWPNPRSGGLRRNGQRCRPNRSQLACRCLLPPLNRAHYAFLLKVENSDARAFYWIEALREGWSARELERLATSRDKEKVPTDSVLTLMHRCIGPFANAFF